jgi:hypothetical protein
LSNSLQTKTNLAPAYAEDLERASAQGTILSIEVDGVVYGKGHIREHRQHHVVVHLIIFGFAALAIASVVVLMKRSDWSDLAADLVAAIENMFKRKKILKAELYEMEDDIPIFDLVEQHQMVKTKVSLNREQSIPQKRMKQLKGLLKKMNDLIHSRSNLSEKMIDELASQVYKPMEDGIANDATDHEGSSTDSSLDEFIDEPTDHSTGNIDRSSARINKEPADRNDVKTDNK